MKRGKGKGWCLLVSVIFFIIFVHQSSFFLLCGLSNFRWKNTTALWCLRSSLGYHRNGCEYWSAYFVGQNPGRIFFFYILLSSAKYNPPQKGHTAKTKSGGFLVFPLTILRGSAGGGGGRGEGGEKIVLVTSLTQKKIFSRAKKGGCGRCRGMPRSGGGMSKWMRRLRGDIKKKSESREREKPTLHTSSEAGASTF